MKFSPCISGQCTEDGTHCQGCGRSHEEIAETKGLVKNIVAFAKKQDYDNIDDFSVFITKNISKKLQEIS
ncbi:MAG: DUF1289 domain-containing protein [Methylomarinum sp.]|nr:DUF1289 domain-containing protein [Methylomarinum sp.]